MRTDTRASSLQRYWKNPDRIKQVKAALRASFLRGSSAKEAAHDVGMSHGNACRWAKTIGFRNMYVTDAERADLIARRARAEKEAA